MAIATQTTTLVRSSKKATLKASSLDSATDLKEPVFPDIQSIRNAIPKHCFESSLWISMGYVVRDVALAGSLGWAALHFIPMIQNSFLRFAAWAIYGYCQGLVCTGIWILGHEAGHGAFSGYQQLNDVIGWVLHSALLVPYFSWKFSHHRHHRFTSHLEKDMAFAPQYRPEQSNQPAGWLSYLSLDEEMLEDAPIVQLVKLIGHQLFGWQLYLSLNATSGKDSMQRKEASWFRQSHFDPTSAVFNSREAVFIVLSDIGLLLVLGALYVLSTYVGWYTTCMLYIVPYFWVHHWLVAITYLHHNHPDVHHYDAEGWTFVKGALATVDRDFGWVGRHLFHGIIDTHVVHHLFPRIPFYRAEEATEAIKPMLGDLYHREDRSFMAQLWSTFTSCKFVEKDPHVSGRLVWAQAN